MNDATNLKTDGLKYRKFDLHVHTPGSNVDFRDQTVTPEQIVQAAIDGGLDAIAVTDHNSATHIDAIKLAAQGTSLTVFPGAEITVSQVHVIALFDIDKTTANITDVLSELGIPHDKQGNTDAYCAKTVEQAAEIIKKHGGLTVLAHVTSDKGVMGAMSGKVKTGIMTSPLILAAEIVDYDDATKKSPTADLLNGKSTEFNNRVLATYRASDNPAGAGTHGHGIQGIGRRASYFKVDKINLRSLRQCFLDPDVRIAQLLDIKTHAHIDSIKVTGGYFDGQEAQLHAGLNTLIGGKGAGKSLLVELLRFGLNKQPDVSEIRADHDGKLATQLKMYSQVDIGFTDETGAKHIVTRKYDSGSNHPYGSDEQRLAVDGFPVLFLSQNEIIAIAQDSQAQLAFVDQFFNFQHHAATIAEFERNIAEYDTQLGSIITAMRTAVVEQKSLQNTTSQIGEIDKQLKSPVFDRYYSAELKKRALDAQRQQLVDAATQLQELGRKDVFKIPVLPTGLEADPALMRTKDEIEKISLSVGSVIAAERAKVSQALLVVDKEIAGFATPYQSSLTAYQIHVRNTGGTKPALAKKRADLVLKQQATTQKLASLKLITDERISVVKRRKELLAELQAAHKEYTVARQKKFAVLQSRSGGRLKLTLYPGENKDVFCKRLLGLKRGSYMRDAEIVEMCEKVSPADFVTAILNYLVTGKPDFITDFATKNDLEPTKLLSLVDFLTVSMEIDELLKLQYEAHPQDRPEIEYNTGTKGASFYRPLSQLSTGQKCTALLIIALCDGGMPVVIDQPEDSLDIKTVWEDMCLKVRSNKTTRQFVFTTHNSSLAVASDSDKFLVVTGTADSGSIIMAGSMDNDEMRMEVIRHLEGDKAAYKKKYVKYELDGVDYTA